MKIVSIGSDAFTEKRRGGFGWFVMVVGHKLIKR